MDSTPNNGKLLFDVGGTFLKAVIADGNGRFVPDTEYSVPMPSDRMHGNRLPRPVRLRTRHSADDAQIPEHIRHIAARPAPPAPAGLSGGEDSGTLPTESLHPQGLPLLRRQGGVCGIGRGSVKKIDSGV